MDDTAADASLTNSTLFGLDSRRGMGKHAAEFVTDFLTIFMINGLGRSRRVEEALALYDEMRTRGIAPDLYTYNSFTPNLGLAGMVEQAGRIYEQLQLVGLEPDVFTYNALIPLYGTSGDPDHANAVYKNMMVGGCSPM
ncbi:hypothetical protein ACFX13_016701 [Malus domestica]